MSKRKRQPNKIQPKPTLYAGVRFRSRLEARWAVFLDNQKNVLNWVYEPTTIITPRGWQYTPDFLIIVYVGGKRQQFYIECKPAPICEATEDDLLLYSRYLNHPLILLINPMFGDAARTIRYKLYMNGSGYGFELTDVFPDHAGAADAALQYRFDLKE